ncbi:MAG: nuclear transport factor 2 family protein [Solirubrobacterales bacterium]
MSEENVERVRSCIDAWNRGDLDAWLADAHPEIEWSSEMARRVEGVDSAYRGIAGLRRFWDELRSVWQLRIDDLETQSVGETVVAHGHLRARGEASGIDLEQPISYVFEFDGGLARRVRGYFNHEEALEAAGLSE